MEHAVQCDMCFLVKSRGDTFLAVNVILCSFLL